MKKCSVIIPTYNSEKYILRCLLSLSIQSVNDIEFIFVDDGSTDRTIDIIKQFTSSDPRFKLISKHHSGVADSRNLGLMKSSGKYIGWVDSDDYVPKRYFETLIDSCEKNESQISMCDMRVEHNGNYLFSYEILNENIRLSSHEALKLLCLDNSCKSWLTNKLFDRDLFSNINFPTLPALEDFAILHILFDKAKYIYYTKETCYNLEQNQYSLTHNIKSENVWQWVYVARDRYEYMLNHHPEFSSLSMACMTNFILLALNLQDNAIIDRNKKNFIRKYLFSILYNKHISLTEKMQLLKIIIK